MKWTCKIISHRWIISRQVVNFVVDSSGNIICPEKELSKTFKDKMLLKIQYKELEVDTRLCRRCYQKEISIPISSPRNQTWTKYNHLSVDEIRDMNLRKLGL